MMPTPDKLLDISNKGLAKVMDLGVKQASVFVSSNYIDITKINYTSIIPCNGVEQPYFHNKSGVGVTVILEDGRTGGGAESNLSVDAVIKAAEKAIGTATPDPYVTGLPEPVDDKPTLQDYHDQRVIDSGGEASVQSAWKALDGAIRTYEKEGIKPEKRVVVNGDVTTVREIMATSSSTGIEATDVSTIMMAYLTTMIEDYDAKGTGWATSNNLDSYSPEDAGRMAAESAISTINGQRIESGKYKVVLGPQAVTDLVQHFLEPAVDAGGFGMGLSPFNGKFGKEVMSPLISVYDDAAVEGMAASKAYTCEGIPTGRTDLIKDGKFIGFLSDKMTAMTWAREHDNEIVADYLEKLVSYLGTNQIPKLSGRNGFRFGMGGGRDYAGGASASATNIFIEGNETMSEEDLIASVEDGVYIGRLWYTYPINGPQQADVTSTAIADSYIIKNGKKEKSLKPNTVRINDNFVKMFNNILGVGDEQYGTVVWHSESIVHAPHLAIDDVQLDNIANFMDDNT